MTIRIGYYRVAVCYERRVETGGDRWRRVWSGGDRYGQVDIGRGKWRQMEATSTCHILPSYDQTQIPHSAEILYSRCPSRMSYRSQI